MTDDDYDPIKDVWDSVAFAFETIRERQRSGGIPRMSYQRKETLAEGVELYLGDCRKVIGFFPPCFRVDAVVTDPPYGLDLGVNKDTRGYLHGLGKDAYASYDDSLENFRAIIVPAVKSALQIAQRGAVFCNHNLHELPKPDVIGGVYVPSSSGRHCWGFNSLSPIAFYGTAPRLHLGSRPSAIQSVEVPEENGHPCPKPYGWMRWLVSHASILGETILDPFMGSGTTGVAAVKLGRRFVGIEIEPKYYDIALRRIEAALRQPDLFIEPPKAPPTQEKLSL